MSHAFDKAEQAVLSTDVATTNYVIALPNHAAAGIPPKVVWVWMTGQASAGNGADDIVFSYGVAISTTNRCYIAGRSNTGVATTVCSTRQAKDVICAELNTSGAATTVGRLDVNDMSTNGQVTLRVTTQFAASYTITVAARGGTDLTNVALFEKVPGAGSVNITDPGFIPDYVETISAGGNTALPYADTARMTFSIGRSMPNSATNHVVSGTALDNLATSNTVRYGFEGECMAWSSNASTITFRGAITGPVANGFVWNNIEGSGSRTLMFLCTKGGTQELDSRTTQFVPDSSPSIQLTSIVGGFLMSHCQVQSTVDVLQDGCEFSLGAFTEPEGANSTRCHGFNDPDNSVGATAGSTAYRPDSLYVNLDAAGAIEGEVTDDETVVNANQFNLAESTGDAVAALLLSVAFGPNAPAAPMSGMTDVIGKHRMIPVFS